MSTTDVLDFIVKKVESIEQLEVLLLLREHRDRVWTARQVNDVIRSSDQSITHHLNKWTNSGLLSLKDRTSGTYVYLPSSRELDSTVGKLAEFYRDRRVTVIEYIYSKSLRKIHMFSDAFKIKKDDQ